jgi:hypothetical protein
LMVAMIPGIAEQQGVFILGENNGAIRIGLCQIPSAEALREIYARFSGYSLCFQALSYSDSAVLKKLLSERSA